MSAQREGQGNVLVFYIVHAHKPRFKLCSADLLKDFQQSVVANELGGGQDIAVPIDRLVAQALGDDPRDVPNIYKLEQSQVVFGMGDAFSRKDQVKIKGFPGRVVVRAVYKGGAEDGEGDVIQCAGFRRFFFQKRFSPGVFPHRSGSRGRDSGAILSFWVIAGRPERRAGTDVDVSPGFTGDVFEKGFNVAFRICAKIHHRVEADGRQHPLKSGFIMPVAFVFRDARQIQRKTPPVEHMQRKTVRLGQAL
ncbi:hypothetical protein SDC9_162428 [bioreactor metagenome]|uniref:Uncharacterized protein n=1 Tax=bioreactor metagenome TaxID=1076179 RepID=A0A645FP19_9ZZZZ